MGYIQGDTIQLEAILTTKGRELLARGSGFEITKFAVADDEVDYSLWTPTHPLGTSYYARLIENMPLTEPVPDETQVMRYKLVTLPRGTKEIPVISLGFTSIAMEFDRSNAVPVRPQTSQGFNGAGFGYTAILYDSTAATLVGSGLPDNVNFTTPAFFGDRSTANAVVARGMEFTISPKDVPSQVSTQLTIIGNQTGAVITIPVIVSPKPTS